MTSSTRLAGLDIGSSAIIGMLSASLSHALLFEEAARYKKNIKHTSQIGHCQGTVIRFLEAALKLLVGEGELIAIGDKLADNQYHRLRTTRKTLCNREPTQDSY